MPGHCGELSDHHPLLLCALGGPWLPWQAFQTVPARVLDLSLRFPRVPRFFPLWFSFIFSRLFLYFIFIWRGNHEYWLIAVSPLWSRSAPCDPKTGLYFGEPAILLPTRAAPACGSSSGAILRGLCARVKMQRLSPSRLPGSHPPIQACGGALSLLQRNRFQTPRIRARIVGRALRGS